MMAKGADRMKTKIAFISLSLLLCLLTGCSNSPVKNDEPLPFSFSGSSETASEFDITLANEQTEADIIAEASTEAVESAESKSESDNQQQTVPEYTESKALMPASQTSESSPKRDESESKPAESTQKSNSTQNTESKPAPAVTPSPEPEQPKPAEPEFDINYWISYAKSYAQGVGLSLNSEAVYCWDNPIAAGAHCKYTERDIKACLNRYAKDEDITEVWVWAQSSGSGSFEVYIGYA